MQFCDLPGTGTRRRERRRWRRLVEMCRRAAGDWPAPLTDHCHLPGGTLRWRRWRRLVQRWRGCGWWWWTPAPSSTAARRRGCCSPSPAPSTRKEQTKLNRDPTPRLVPWLGRYRQHGANDIRFETVDTLNPNQSPFQKDTNGLATTSWILFFFFKEGPREIREFLMNK